MEEGSVMVDGMDSEVDSTEETSTTENVNNQVESEGKEDSSSETTSESPESTVETSEAKEEKPVVEKQEPVTEKGTKLDPDPLSRANQLRANAEAEVRNYTALLNDPERLETYIKELKAEKGTPEAKAAETTDFDSLDVSKLETVADLQKFAAGLKEASRKEIAAVKKELSGITSSQKEEGLSRQIQSSISEVQSKYPELRELNADGSKNPDYNPELDELVGSTYNTLDFDKKTGKYKGIVELGSIAEKIISAKRIGEGAGARKAQTDVIDKRLGRVVGTQPVSDNTRLDDSKLSASATIAERMKRAASRR